MKNQIFVMIFAALALTACGQVGAEAQATTVAMAVQLTTIAQETEDAAAQATATPTEQVEATPTHTAEPTATPEPTATDLPEPTATPYEVPDWPLFRNGDEGPEVYAIQWLLRAQGYNLSVDGQFGAQTRSRVIAFQGDQGLAADGIVGPNTWGALVDLPLVNENDNGPAVRAVQHLLSEKFGYNSVAVDGDFGPITDDAVRDFQSAYDLQVDGIVGPNTWQALIAIEP
jgi:peptidoglycan hydrolase-like protein with peptidoglycan-binding domain